MWYKSDDNLQKDEESDLFPPRFKLQVVNKDCNESALNLYYKICVRGKKKKEVKDITLNIFRDQGFASSLIINMLNTNTQYIK